MFFGISSCKKEDETRKATATVIDQDGHAVANAKTTVYVNSKYANTYIDPRDPDNMIKEEVKYTNGSGIVEYEYQFDCVFEIKAEKEIYQDGVLVSVKKGTGTLVFRKGEDYETKIIIK